MSVAARRGALTWARRATAALIAAELLVGGGVLFIRSRDQVRPVSVDTAVERFRSSQAEDETPSTTDTTSGAAAAPGAEPPAASPAPAPPATRADISPAATSEPAPVGAAKTSPTSAAAGGPRPGVYVYATTGHEETDALGGARHDYPAQSTITVRSGGCGITARWDVLEGRSDESELCPQADGSTLIASFTARHAFYGHSDERTLTCDPGSVQQPAPGRPPGASWTFRCRSETTEQTTVSTLVGRETLEVGGTSVEVVHIRQRAEAGGDSGGTRVRDLWLTVAEGLLVRERSEIDATSVAGAIRARYHERYELRLTSLTPQR